MPGVVAYLRVSTEEQADSGLGLAAQEAAIRAECERRHLEIVSLHTDAGLSGKSLDRPALAAALADLDAGQGDVLMVSKLDRLSRSVHDATGLMLRAEKAGWGLVALDVSVDTTTPQGMAMAQMLSVFAELERRLIGERTKAALAVKKSNGTRLGRPRTVPDEVVEMICALRDAGATWRAIAEELNRTGIATGQGGNRWHPATARLLALRGGGNRLWRPGCCSSHDAGRRGLGECGRSREVAIGDRRTRESLIVHREKRVREKRAPGARH